MGKRMKRLLRLAGLSALTYTYVLGKQAEEKEELDQLIRKDVTVKGKRVSIEVSGEGKDILIAFPGLSSGSVTVSYKPLMSQLAERFTIAVVEPLNYGSSDDTDESRDVDTVAEEYHEIIKQIGAKHYYLMAHSLGGIYCLKMMEKYPEEVKGYIGLDTTVPEAYEYMDEEKEGEQAGRILSFFSRFGITRLLYKLDKERFEVFAKDYPYTEEDLEKARKVLLRRMYLNSLQKESEKTGYNLLKMRDVLIPETIPVCNIVSKQTDEYLVSRGAREGLWIDAHRRQSANRHSVCEVLDLPHTMHITDYKKVSEVILRWMDEKR